MLNGKQKNLASQNFINNNNNNKQQNTLLYPKNYINSLSRKEKKIYNDRVLASSNN